MFSCMRFSHEQIELFLGKERISDYMIRFIYRSRADIVRTAHACSSSAQQFSYRSVLAGSAENPARRRSNPPELEVQSASFSSLAAVFCPAFSSTVRILRTKSALSGADRLCLKVESACRRSASVACRVISTVEVYLILQNGLE